MAFEVRFLLFDVWGDHMQTLSATKVSDLNGQMPLGEAGSWRAWENDVSELLTVVSFPARVRTADGRTWNYDPVRLLREVERIKVKLTEKELSPEQRRPRE